jgi:outer membrane protein
MIHRRSSSAWVNPSDPVATHNDSFEGETMKICKTLAALMLMTLSASVLAEVRIAVVDINAAAMRSDEARLRGEKLKTTFGHDESELIALRNSIQKLEEKRQKDAAVMGAEELRKLEQEINDKKLEMNFKGQKLQQKGKEANQELQQVMGPKVEKAMKSIIDEKKYDVILRREAAIWIDEKYDLTDELTKRINAQK